MWIQLRRQLYVSNQKLVHVNQKDRVIQFKILQNSIDNTAAWDLSGFIRTSDKEVIQKMRALIRIFSWEFENKSW